MTDRELLAKKLAQISGYLHEIETLARLDRIEDDLREQRFLLYTLQTAIQAALDAASHVVSDERLGEPRTNRELFELLGNRGWLPPGLAARLAPMAQFRNLIVHGYGSVDLGKVRHIVENDLEDLRSFVLAIRERLDALPE